MIRIFEVFSPTNIVRVLVIVSVFCLYYNTKFYTFTDVKIRPVIMAGVKITSNHGKRLPDTFKWQHCSETRRTAKRRPATICVGHVLQTALRNFVTRAVISSISYELVNFYYIFV